MPKSTLPQSAGVGLVPQLPAGSVGLPAWQSTRNAAQQMNNVESGDIVWGRLGLSLLSLAPLSERVRAGNTEGSTDTHLCTRPRIMNIEEKSNKRETIDRKVLNHTWAPTNSTNDPVKHVDLVRSRLPARPVRLERGLALPIQQPRHRHRLQSGYQQTCARWLRSGSGKAQLRRCALKVSTLSHFC